MIAAVDEALGGGFQIAGIDGHTVPGNGDWPGDRPGGRGEHSHRGL